MLPRSSRQNWKDEGQALPEEMRMKSKRMNLPKLTPEQIEHLCLMSEAAARKYIHQRTSKREIAGLDITIETSYDEELTIDILVNIELSPFSRLDSDSLAQEAVDIAFGAIEEKLREITRCSRS